MSNQPRLQAQGHPLGFGHAPSSIHLRPALRWPGNKPLALAFMVSAETYEIAPPDGAHQPPNLPGGFGRGPYPDLRAWSTREYGNRIGFFRVADELARHGFRAALAVDALTAMHRAPVIRRAQSLGWELAAHGRSVTQMVSSEMDEATEHAHLASAIDDIAQACGIRPTAWHGAEYGESMRTPGLLAGLGIHCLLDWTNDEQPFAIESGAGRVVAVPVAIDLDDVFAHWHRKVDMARWCAMVLEAATRLAEDGKTSGRCLVVNLHPWLIGQPWRATYLRELLAALSGMEGVWRATPQEIALAWRASDQAAG